MYPEPVEDLPDRVDVAVVGASIAGVWAARGLARSGASVALVDPLHDAGWGGSGLLQIGLAEHPARTLASLGPERGRALFSCFERSAALLGPLAQPTEQIWVASARGEGPLIEQSAAALRSLGYAVDLIGRSALAERNIAGDLAMRLQGDALVDPDACWRSLLESAAAAGVLLCRALARATPDDPRGVRVETDKGSFCAEIVIFAAGFGARSLDRIFDASLWPVRESAARYPGLLPALSGRAGLGWTWFRPAPSGQEIVVGGCRWATAHLEIGETLPEIVPAVQQHIDTFARQHLGLSAPAVARGSLIETHTCDGLPLVGPLPGDSRRIACLGFGGNPFGLAPAAAEDVVQGLLQGGAAGALMHPTRLA